MSFFSKEAVTLPQLRNANQALKDAGKYIRRNLDATAAGTPGVTASRARNGVEESFGLGPAAINKITPAKFRSRLEAMGYSPEISKAVMEQGAGRQIVDATNHLAGPSGRVFIDKDLPARLRATPTLVADHRLLPALDSLSPAGKETFNRAVVQHESAEIGKHFGNRPFASHLSTRPMLQDLNIAATLQGPGADAADALRRLRRDEVADLTSFVPEIERLDLGNQRISRHAQKRLQELYEKRTKTSGERREVKLAFYNTRDTTGKQQQARYVVSAFLQKRANMKMGPAAPKMSTVGTGVMKPPSAEPVKAPAPPKAFTPQKPAFVPKKYKSTVGVTSGSITG